MTHKLSTGETLENPAYLRGAGGIKTADVAESFGLGWHLGQAFDYIVRAGRKNVHTEAEDLRKAAWWLRRAAGLVTEWNTLECIRVVRGVSCLSKLEVLDGFALNGERRLVAETVLNVFVHKIEPRAYASALVAGAEMLEGEATDIERAARACTVCGLETMQYRSVCGKCSAAKAHQRMIERARAATVIEDDGRPVYSDQFSGSWGDGYSGSLTEHMESWADENGDDAPPPCFVFATVGVNPSVDFDSVVEGLGDNQHEDFDAGDCDGLDALSDAIDTFNAAQSAGSFEADYSRIIIIDGDRFAALVARTEAEAAA